MTYVRLPSPVPLTTPAALVVNGKKQCSHCRQWKAPYDFESKGIRSGRHVRRGVCIACRSLRQWMQKPLMDDGVERKCKRCGRWRLLTRFHRVGDGRRMWICRHCHRKSARGNYHRLRRNAGKVYTPRPKTWKQEWE